MEKRIGLLLGNDFDLLINPKRLSNGLIDTGFSLGPSIDQEAAIVLKMNQGELKEDPLLGPSLTKFMRGGHSTMAIEHRIRQHLTRAGIDYDSYKDRISTTIKNREQ